MKSQTWRIRGGESGREFISMSVPVGNLKEAHVKVEKSYS